jgi:sugar/nucleoside kinase (ribokinase family)
MRALVDTDILLDVALAREPHAAASADVLRWAEAGGTAAVSWHSLTNCAYLLKGGGRPFLQRLLRLVDVAAVGKADARRALDLPITDIDDAFQAAAALAWAADVIVTRNLADYRRSPVRALPPAAFLKQIRRLG